MSDRFPGPMERNFQEWNALRARVEADGNLIVNAERYRAAQEACRLLLDAVDMMGDGPDDSDVAHANGQLAAAVAKAKEARG